MSESVNDTPKTKTLLDKIEKIDLVSLMTIGRKRKKKDKHYARFNRRMMAGTIDTLILVLFAPLFDRLAPIADDTINVDLSQTQTSSQMLAQLFSNHEFIVSWMLNTTLQITVFCIFSGICWHFWSSTPGKMIMRIKIVDEKTEQPISDRQIVLRLLGYWVSCAGLFIGFGWIGIDKKKRAWQDLMAGTTVVTIPWKRKKKAEEI